MSNAVLTDLECTFESITMQSGVSIHFAVENDPEMCLSGLLDPEDCWDWVV